jgi:hypothetical protein
MIAQSSGDSVGFAAREKHNRDKPWLASAFNQQKRDPYEHSSQFTENKLHSAGHFSIFQRIF